MNTASILNSYLLIIQLLVASEPCEEGFCDANERHQSQMNIPTLTFIDKIGKVFSKIKRDAMAWRSSGGNNIELVNNLRRNGIFSDERVKTAMLSVDRADFAPHTPYEDHPVSIGYGATISAPHMHASSLQLLKDQLKEGARVLDVGSGSGYLTVCMATMVGETGKVVGIEHIEELAELAKKNTRKNHANLLDNGRILYVVGDGREGYENEAPYDAIHVGAAAPSLPDKLVTQLARGGRMLIPVGAVQSNQRFLQVDKDQNGGVKITDLMGVIYVPLTDRNQQIGY